MRTQPLIRSRATGRGGRDRREIGALRAGHREINYPAVATALEELGYRGTVGLEAWASGDSQQALERFREAFTSEPGGAGR